MAPLVDLGRRGVSGLAITAFRESASADPEQRESLLIIPRLPSICSNFKGLSSPTAETLSHSQITYRFQEHVLLNRGSSLPC